MRFIIDKSDFILLLTAVYMAITMILYVFVLMALAIVWSDINILMRISIFIEIVSTAYCLFVLIKYRKKPLYWKRILRGGILYLIARLVPDLVGWLTGIHNESLTIVNCIAGILVIFGGILNKFKYNDSFVNRT